MVDKVKIFKLMAKEGFTTFTIKKNKKDSTEIDLLLSKEWNEKVEWKGEKTKGLIKKKKEIKNEKVKKLINKYGLENYLKDIIYIFKEGNYQLLELLYEPISEFKAIVTIHQKNKRYTVGTIRKCALSKPELESIIQSFKLARGISFRCAVSSLPCGGASLFFLAPKSKIENIDKTLGFLGYVLKRYKVKWGTEAGFTIEEIQKLSSFYKDLVTLKDKKDIITPSTAYSIYLCIKETINFRYNTSNLKDKIIGIYGLGRIGSALGKLLLKEGVDLIVSDMDSEQIKNFIEEANNIKEGSVQPVSVGEIRMQMGHVYSPCALNSILSRDTLREIQYNIIVGGANNLLDGNTVDDEIQLAKRLHNKEIIFIPDWISNIGAIVSGTSLFLEKKEVSLDNIKNKLKKICPSLVREILEKSSEKNISPLEYAFDKFSKIVYGK